MKNQLVVGWNEEDILILVREYDALAHWIWIRIWVRQAHADSDSYSYSESLDRLNARMFECSDVSVGCRGAVVFPASVIAQHNGSR